MSLTSYRAAPSRVNFCDLRRPGSPDFFCLSVLEACGLCGRTGCCSIPRQLLRLASAGQPGLFLLVRPRSLRPLRSDGMLLHPASTSATCVGRAARTFSACPSSKPAAPAVGRDAAPSRIGRASLPCLLALPMERAACAARDPVWRALFAKRRFQRALGRPGSDLLSRVLRRSTISAGAFHGRVRNGNGCSHPAITTRSAKRTLF